MTFVISPKISEFSSRAQKWKSENSKEARLDWNLRITSAFNSLLVFPISMYALFSELEWSNMFSFCPAAKLRSGFDISLMSSELSELVTGNSCPENLVSVDLFPIRTLFKVWIFVLVILFMIFVWLSI